MAVNKQLSKKARAEAVATLVEMFKRDPTTSVNIKDWDPSPRKYVRSDLAKELARLRIGVLIQDKVTGEHRLAEGQLEAIRDSTRFDGYCLMQQKAKLIRLLAAQRLSGTEDEGIEIALRITETNRTIKALQNLAGDTANF